jgi:GNAT superfamily N-acetyltransferase
MMKGFPAYHLLMPSPPDWVELAREVYGERLEPFTRYQFSSAELSSDRLADCWENSKYRSRIIPISSEIAARLVGRPESYLEISEFDSVQDFIERGMGYTALDGEKVMGVAYSSLICSQGIEVSVYVEEKYRQKGVATALASRLLLDCLKRGLRPNWDAANRESFRLAQKLGYTFIGTYDAFYHVE